MATTWAVENDQEERKQQQSLLVQALSGDSRYRREPAIPIILSIPDSSHSSGLSLEACEPTFLGMSDFTIHTSNIKDIPDAPDNLLQPTCTTTCGRRSVFGAPVSQKYRIARVQSTDTLPTEHIDSTSYDRTISDLTPPMSPIRIVPSQLVSPLTPYNNNKNNNTQHERGKQRAHETIHAQSLLLGLAFMAIWSPQNGMAPNLTAISEDFGFSAAERDLYLGSILALATGVLSLPLSAGIGILADVYNRKHLFVLTVAMGGLCSWATGASHSYRWLFWARLANGGFMSGSVPVAFSLLGDLFHTNERNAASSGLTAMMGMGIITGQVYAGVVGSTLGWPHMFYVSAIWTVLSAVLVLVFVQEPVRGGKEQVLQDMLRQGTNYDRKLTWAGFLHAMQHNRSNALLMWQGFFSSVPWGIIFVFLNDYLSQERGFSVPDATYLVFMFGLGCAAGGVLGGWWGQVFAMWNRSYLVLFMSGTTFLGIFPFVGLLNGSFTNAHGVEAVFYSFMGGLIASLPSVNVRPCIINVNPPETRGAALTAANLIICLGRGIGPSCITLMGAIWHVNRRFSFNVTLAFFWIVAALQLLLLSRTLPNDQDAMEAELAEYAESRMQETARILIDDEDSIVSIEDRMTSFDAGAARQTIRFMGEAFREISDEIGTIRPLRASCQLREDPRDDDDEKEEEDEEAEDDTAMDKEDFERRKRIWRNRQLSKHRDRCCSDPATETTSLL